MLITLYVTIKYMQLVVYVWIRDNLHTDGNKENCFFCRQFTKCALVLSCHKVNLAGLRPKAMVVALAIENTLQSVYPDCFCDFITLI